jgi:hypothetical protein
MDVTVIVGVFFLVLAAVFGFATRRDYLAAQRHWSPACRAHFRVAIIFTLVGAGLVVWKLIFK